MKKHYLFPAIFAALLLSLSGCRENRTGVFALLDARKTGGAADEVDLLDYFRSRDMSSLPCDRKDFTPKEKDRKIADEALVHRFYVHDAYQPSFFYGEDIDWTYWPVKDNELRWQLHRQKWFTPMGVMYQATGDEKYVREYVYEFRDWIRKNPNGGPAWQQPGGVVSAGEIAQDAPNWEFAWRPLEVGIRLMAHMDHFRLFLNAPEFTPDFLSEFLVNYHEHLSFLSKNIAPRGNHRLFEAQAILFGSLFFPEFKESRKWQKEALKILREEIELQILPDGVQEELDQSYHNAMIDVYASVLQYVQDERIRERVGEMIAFTLGMTYPDYTFPCFGDCRLHGKDHYLSCLQDWLKVFPENEHLRWFATEGREGSPYTWKSRAWHDAGFYVYRTGWGPDDTVLVIKAGKAGAWHAQPDYGTFEIWSAGRNISPDSGCYIYGGDEEVTRMRDWFRQTRVHNTLTLDGENVERTDCRELAFSDSTLVYEHDSYKGLTHKRTYSWRGTSLELLDEAYGPAEGTVEVHFFFAPGLLTLSGPVVEGPGMKVSCTSSVPGAFREEDGWYSQVYRQRARRQGAVYEIRKSASDTLRIRSVINIL